MKPVFPSMLLRLPVLLLMLFLPARGQNGDDPGVKMDPVVPEKLIPPSPVLPIAEALKTFKLAPGFVIEPVAAEPLVDMPVCLDFDGAGRMWVCEMRGYMPDIDGKGESVPEGRIVILEDTDKDGKADKRTVFLDKLLLPRAVAVFEKGVLFADEKRLCWVERNGDAPSGEPKEIAPGLLGGGNVEHKPNGLLPNLDNRLYLAKSDKRLRRTAAGWEIEPTAFRGQWGIARDDQGRLYHNNNSTLLFGDLLAPNLLTGNPRVRMKFKDFVQLGSNRVWPARVTPGVNRAYVAKEAGFPSDTLDPRTHKLVNATAAAGLTLYRGTNFPKEWQGTAFCTEPVANLLKAVHIAEKDGSMTGEHPLDRSEFLASTDERFRPVNAYTAPDGSLYLLDMYHGIIQHKTYMTTYLRKQTLARGLDAPPMGLGRIYRIRASSGKMEAMTNPAAMQGLELVKVLMHPNAWQREMAQRLLVERADSATVPFLEKLTAAGPVPARTHAIWTLEGMAALKAGHLLPAIQSSEPELQSSALWAATRLAPEELAKLSPAIVSARPAAPEVLPYLARALGPIGSRPAFERLAALLKAPGDAPLLREAAVSGLAGQEAAFLSAAGSSLKDKELSESLAKAGSAGAFGERGPVSLKGEALASYQRGKTLFHGEAACFGCHGADGSGMPNLGPPLDESGWVTGKPERLIRIMLHGMTGPVTVAGQTYEPQADMPGLGMNPAMNDQALADIATYIRNEWNNHAEPLTPAFVKAQRDQTRSRGGKAWTAAELGE